MVRDNCLTRALTWWAAVHDLAVEPRLPGSSHSSTPAPSRERAPAAALLTDRPPPLQSDRWFILFLAMRTTVASNQRQQHLPKNVLRLLLPPRRVIQHIQPDLDHISHHHPIPPHGPTKR